jgi:hypothetical protein
MLKRPIILFSIIVVLAIISVLAVLVIESPESKIKQNLNLYQNSRLIFEDSAAYGAGAAQKNLYYWSSDPLTNIQAHYEKVIGDFVTSEDQGKEWLINAFEVNGPRPTPDTSSDFLVHKSFCPNINNEYCVSVAIVAADQPDVYMLPIMSPSGFRRSTMPTSFKDLNPQGTFIIYSYWVKDF